MAKETRKWLYEFSAKDKDGNVKEFAILKPNRNMREEGDIYKDKQTFRYAQAGIPMAVVYATLLENTGGTISESEQKENEKIVEVTKDLIDKQKKLEKESEEYKTTEEEIKGCLTKLAEFKTRQLMLFENTAEAKARNKAVTWWTIGLAHVKNDKGEYVDFFKGKDLEDKLDYYDELADAEDEFSIGVSQRFSHLIVYWYLNGITKTDEFKKIDDEFVKKDEEKVAAPEVEVKTEVKE